MQHIMSKTSAQANQRTNREAVVAVIVVIPIHVATVEVQLIGVIHVVVVKRTTPIVTVTTHIVHTAIVTVTCSRKEL